MVDTTISREEETIIIVEDLIIISNSSSTRMSKEHRQGLLCKFIWVN